ncbi:L-lysine 6-transaminase [Amycolatopsis balhimycina DSM 5908]|uniref:L-lysine-epsilon aminotransferase n=1 Tax=Amycolatopsis balhimycina DSM 5908 TaxID=1081091 RepID=A0A428WRV8_AMYBA|nr:L-lysine 6-transaminase [Amycolatopsis balhimycina]RSM45789.1 L-lysine 6-transaminase [Amycolatopsis balhimycina DSM 5908]
MNAAEVLSRLGRHVLVDGYDFVLDLDASNGSYLVDSLTKTRYLDFFSFFSSAPLGMNHPALREDREFLHELARAAVHKPANPDVYTVEYATFVERFAAVLGDPALPRLFFIDGGTLAVENALKAAFDWKARRAGLAEGDGSPPLVAMHLTGAFHGRSGYALSMTNTDPRKTDLFPKFDWPRITAPVITFPDDVDDPTALRAREAAALAQAEAAFADPRWTVACFVAEVIQGEGGDRHLSAEFLLAMQRLCHQADALFVVDEVQTGGGTTGTAWAYEQLGLEPDLVAFGKKTQVCGVMAGRRIDWVPDNVFRVSSRISSTWGGNLVDMVRATRIFDVMERDQLIPAAAKLGDRLLLGLREIGVAYTDVISNVRGRGLLCAFDLPDPAGRDAVIDTLRTRCGVLVLPSGERSVRFRPPLTVSEEDIDRGLTAVADVLERYP